MSRPSVAVTGSTGLLGRDLVREARTQGRQVIGLARTEASPCDLLDAAAVADALSAVRPEVVIHTAAWSDVDGCELDPDTARRLNVEATANVAAAAAAVGAHLVYLSTDYVYDGTKAEPYVETDPTGPLSVYGRTKLEGEAAAGPGATIARTSWLAGRHGKNMVATIVRLGEGAGELRFVDDQRGNPTFTGDLAGLLLRLGDDRVGGVVHATNQGSVSWYGLAREVLELAGHDPDRVHPIASADLTPPRPAPRPGNSVMAPAALEALGYEPLRHHAEPLAKLVTALLNEIRGR